jgi:hypothetical protein
MAEDGKLDKLKEQYVDEILAIVPLSQAIFIVLMAIVSDSVIEGKAWSVIHSLNSVGLKSSLGPDDGRFWSIGLLSLCISFGLALFNTFLLRVMLSHSLKKARLATSLVSWQRQAVARVAGLTDPQKQTIQASFKAEIDARLRKYKAKRISTEMTASLTAMAGYANVLIAFCAYKKGISLEWSWLESSFVLGSGLMCFLLHRASLRYAISKILPLKVYVGVLTGELIFFEELTG